MFFKKKTPKSGTARLEQEMAAITAQALSNVNSLRAGKPLSPITHVETETLFAEKNGDGETIYNHYHFTDDTNELDPEAQIHLMKFFGQIIAFNEMLAHPGVEKRLDWIAANANFFERYFARADFSTDVLTERPMDEVKKKLQSITADDKVSVQKVLAGMTNPQSIDSMVPRPTFPLLLAVGKPYQDGQKFINGVYFSAEAAPAVMNWLTSLQAQTMEDNNPAHA